MEMTVLNNYNQPLAGGRHVTGYEQTAMGGFGDSSQENMAYDSMDSGEDVDGPAHREMAIDVPANFIGQKKEPPRYPTSGSRNAGYPGTAPGSQALTQPHKISSVKKPQPTYKPPGTPPLPRSAPPPPLPHQRAPDMTADEELASVAKIQMYQQDLRKRKEQEESFQREQEFLRNSLRDSQKLKELQENGPKPNGPNAGFVNPNYMIEEEESLHGDGVSTASTLPVRQRPGSAAHARQLGQCRCCRTCAFGLRFIFL